MTRTYCDRCKKEITNDMIIHHFSMCEDDGLVLTGCDICDSCYDAFKSFMKMEYSTCHTNPVNNHGIERMTFGSK